MKKVIVFSILITGFAGFALLQSNLTQQSGAGETRPTQLAVPEQKSQQSQSIEIGRSAEIEPVSKIERGKEKISLPAMINSDEVADNTKHRPVDGTEAYVNSAKPEQIAEYYATLRVARAELLQNQFNQESQDPAWSDTLAARFSDAYQLIPGLPKLQLSKSDCRETICALHIDMKKDTYKKYAPYMQHIGTVLGTDTWIHHDALPDTAILYVARVDTELPKLSTN